ncbi:DUF3772 domain-containing protein [Profundibacter sp.]
MMRPILSSLLIVTAIVFSAMQMHAQDVVPKQSGSYTKSITNTLSAWERTARRAEEAIEAGRASTSAFEELRSQLVTWRENFLVAQSTNAGSIKTLQSQIVALGPKPDGVEEAAEIAAQRIDLEMRMAQLRAPAKTAEVAHSRADGLIRSIDEIIRARQTDALLERGPLPLNPLNWAKAQTAIKLSSNSVIKEVRTAWRSPTQQVILKKNLPVVVVLLLISVVLLLRGRHWMERLTQAVQVREHSTGRWVLAFVLSIAQVVLPLFGVLLLIEAIYATELVGVRGDNALSAMVGMAVAFLLARWLGGRIFPKSQYVIPPLNLEPAMRRKGRFFSGAIGLLLGAGVLVTEVSRFDSWSIEAFVTTMFPVLLLVGYGLLRLSRLIRRHVQNERVDGEERSYRNRIIYYLSRIVLVLAIAGPSLAAIGYFEAAKSIVFSTAMSLGLLAFLLILHRMISEIYALVTGNAEAAKEALIPVLISFAMVLVSTPVFALIWGVRVADLTELWTRFKEGFLVGGSRISPSDFLTFAVVFAIGFMITRLIQGTLRTTVLPKTKMDVGGRNAIVSGVGYIGIFLAALVAISSAGIDLSSLAIVAGALSVGIGFGLQNIVSNFVAGIILLIERPISEGDWIEVGGQMGYVRDISVRSTRIETFDRTDVIVPNSDLISGMVTNWTRGNSVGRVIVPVGVAYGTDTKHVEGLLRKIAEAHPMVLANPAVIFQGFGADSLDFEIRAILRDVNWMLSVKSDINHEIARVFSEEGIEIPFAQRDVWLRNPEALHPEPVKPAKAPAKTPRKGAAK